MAEPASAWKDSLPGSKMAFAVPVARRADGSAVQLPVLLVRGQKPGKAVLLTAGVHGDEFEGMAALRRLWEELTPDTVSGTLAAIPLANPPAYEAGLRTNPDDRQDLARVFPGDPAGTVTEQIAWCLTQQFIRHADFYCDLHSAGQYYLMPFMVGYQLRPEPLLSAQRAAARVFGAPLVWGTPGMPGRSLTAAAEFGVPALYAETTGQGRLNPVEVKTYLEGLRRLLHHLGLIAQAPPADPPAWVVEDARPNAGFLQVQNRAPVGGIFEPAVEVLRAVKKGQKLGVLRDPLGTVLHTVQAPHDGLVVFLRTFPRVLPGDPLCTVVEMD